MIAAPLKQAWPCWRNVDKLKVKHALINLVMERIRRRESSDSKIMPSILSYSSNRT